MAYGDFVLMRDLNFTISHGDRFVIMGGSGSGKSTLMRHMIGLMEPARGEIRYEGESFTKASPAERHRILRRLGVMYQGGALWSSMTLEENIALPLEKYSSHTEGQIASIVRYKLALVGLAGFGGYYPSEISGGMAKRAAVARALALEPEVLLLDEPSSGLDPLSSRRLDETILELSETLGMTIVVVTHDLDSIFTIATHSVFLDANSKTQAAVGNPVDLRDHARSDTVRRFLSRTLQNTEEEVTS